MKYLDLAPGDVQRLAPYGTLPASVHVFDGDTIEATNAALAAGRPLLVRGEPGTGKSQLARAVATALDRALLSFTADARTEARDLMFTIDTISRLAEAQILGHLPHDAKFDVRQQLSEGRFTSPGPLWWLFDWPGAERQAALGGGARPWTPEGWTAPQGAVLLLDEIDKADPAVPNGLLEALGQGQFLSPGGTMISATVSATDSACPPLVVVTTNEERALPDAFVRRCLVLQLGWPADREDLIDALMARGGAHFEKVEEKVLRAAAEMVASDRLEIAKRGVCPPGGAEYLDLLRAVSVRWPGDTDQQAAALRRIGAFALRKHPEAAAW